MLMFLLGMIVGFMVFLIMSCLLTLREQRFKERIRLLEKTINDKQVLIRKLQEVCKGDNTDLTIHREHDM